MGSVKGTRITANNKVEYVISIDYEEALLLQGHVTNVHVFSEDCAQLPANIISRGKGDTKYLRIPSRLSKEIKASSEARCLRLDAGDRILIFTVIEK